MRSSQGSARLAGACYLVTIATSISALALKQGVLSGAPSAAAAVHWAILLEVLLALSCIATAVALYPLLRRHSEHVAVAFVASRVLEASLIAAGVLAVSGLQAVSGRPDAGVVHEALVAAHDAAFLLGPGLLPAVNAALLGGLLWRTGLVPRIIPTIGLVGAPLLAASFVGVLFGGFGQVSLPASILALPVAAWELSLGVWLVVRGLREPREPSSDEPAVELGRVRRRQPRATDEHAVSVGDVG